MVSNRFAFSIVVAIHMALLVCIGVLGESTQRSKRPSTPLIVHTKQIAVVTPPLEAPTQQTTVKPPPNPTQPSKLATPMTEAKPATEVVPKETPVQRTATATKSPPPPKQPSKIATSGAKAKPTAVAHKGKAKHSSDRLEKVRKQIAKIGAVKSSESPHSASSVEIPVLSSLQEVQVSESGYAATLATHLKQALQLPEYGSVRVELDVLRDGSVAAVRVLEAHSPLNEQYVLSTLPTMRLPPLNAKRETFTLTFQNG